ncbi:MAG TPA: hypothetical protein VGV14_03170, partial [Rhodanobacter sp.]|nr:hypothetical protein [Rhodanobacter sp.]
MSVRPAGAERGNPGNPWKLAPLTVKFQDRTRPGCQALLHDKGRVGKFDIRIERACMQARRQGPVFQLHQYFADTDESARTFAVADIRLGRADGAELRVLGPV